MKRHYKLRMLKFNIYGPSQIMVDNESVTICSITFRILKKKHNSIAYRQVREAVAACVTSIAHIHVKFNPYDLLTNPLGP